MLTHEFGIMKINPIPNKRYDAYEPVKYGCISIHDDLIKPLLKELSTMDCYWHTLNRPEKGLAYYGVTLIPPSSMQQFVPILEGRAELDGLKSLVLKAKAEDKFVIHFGI